MVFYVYILQSQRDGSFYYGQTSDLSDRLRRHNSGAEKYTNRKAPWKLFWHTAVDSRAQAMKLEKRLKNLKSTNRMMKFISGYGAGPVA
jgi:putative endonuclease